MTKILHRQIHASLPVAVGGQGVHLLDADGRSYIDASGGAAVSGRATSVTSCPRSPSHGR
jgi:4-aminobutyrate aminotransferase-like enzyme